MPYRMSFDEFNELTNHSNIIKNPLENPESAINITKKYGKANIKHFSITDEIVIFYSNISLNDKLILDFNIDEKVVILGFILSGNILSKNRTEEFYIQKNHSILFYAFGDDLKDLYNDENIHFVYLILKKSLFIKYLNMNEEIAPNISKLLKEFENSMKILDYSNLSLKSLNILQDILNPPFEGNLKRMFLEAKVLEILAIKFDEIAKKQDVKKSNLSKDDIERIYFAKEILLKNMKNPPTIKELAKLTSTNDFKLKKGFKEIFGTTIFNLLYEERMSLAKDLIETKEFNIKEVSAKIGYKSQSHFSVAFNKKFGVNPSEIFK